MKMIISATSNLSLFNMRYDRARRNARSVWLGLEASYLGVLLAASHQKTSSPFHSGVPVCTSTQIILINGESGKLIARVRQNVFAATVTPNDELS